MTTGAFTGTLIDRSFREKIVLVGVVLPDTTVQRVQDSLVELALRVDTAGAGVVGKVIERRQRLDPATFIGEGKVSELAGLARSLDADTVVFDENLSPAQQRNLESQLGRTAIDRTAVILDIFAQNAKTPEGKAQVELALLRYRLPRLRGRGRSFSQQAGGIGTRGPGETQLEIDRRRLLQRIRRLESDLKNLDKTRGLQRRGRERGRLREVALVGYTNAGKSSLLNALTSAGVDTADRLFVTLDPRTRQLALPGGETVLLTDTVGFIKKLPHELVEAFRTTLHSLRSADLLLHVVDASAPDIEDRIDAVHSVVDEVGARDVPEMIVFNKADLLDDPDAGLRLEDAPVNVSARTREGLDEMVAQMADRLRTEDRLVEFRVPFDRGDVLAALHREGEVLKQYELDQVTVVNVLLDAAGRARFCAFEQGAFEKGEIL